MSEPFPNKRRNQRRFALGKVVTKFHPIFPTKILSRKQMTDSMGGSAARFGSLTLAIL